MSRTPRPASSRPLALAHWLALLAAWLAGGCKVGVDRMQFRSYFLPASVPPFLSFCFSFTFFCFSPCAAPAAAAATVRVIAPAPCVHLFPPPVRLFFSRRVSCFDCFLFFFLIGFFPGYIKIFKVLESKYQIIDTFNSHK